MNLVPTRLWSRRRDRGEIAVAGQFTHDHDLGFADHDSAGLPISVRELLVHMIGEHARHGARADLLSDRIMGASASHPRQRSVGARRRFAGSRPPYVAWDFGNVPNALATASAGNLIF